MTDVTVSCGSQGSLAGGRQVRECINPDLRNTKKSQPRLTLVISVNKRKIMVVK